MRLKKPIEARRRKYSKLNVERIPRKIVRTWRFIYDVIKRHGGWRNKILNPLVPFSNKIHQL